MNSAKKREYNREYMKVYNARPDVKKKKVAYMKEYVKRDYVAKKIQSPEEKAKCAARHKRSHAKPEYRAKQFLNRCAWHGHPCTSSVAEVMNVQEEKCCYLCGATDCRLHTDHEHNPNGAPVRHMLCTRHNTLAQDEAELVKVLEYVRSFK